MQSLRFDEATISGIIGQMRMGCKCENNPTRQEEELYKTGKKSATGRVKRLDGVIL